MNGGQCLVEIFKGVQLCVIVPLCTAPNETSYSYLGDLGTGLSVRPLLGKQSTGGNGVT